MKEVRRTEIKHKIFNFNTFTNDVTFGKGSKRGGGILKLIFEK